VRVIAFANQKGGCGKTTTATNLAAALSQMEKRVLLLDNDPQGHATLALGFRERDFTLSTYDLYLTSDILVEDAFLSVRPELHLVPAGVELAAVEQALARAPDKDLVLRRSLRRSALPYDYILIDCPPTVSLLTVNALLASDEAVIPVDPSTFSLQAVQKMRETLGVLRQERQHDVIPRLLLSNVDTRPRFVRRLVEELEQLHGRELLETAIHQTVRYREAAGAGVPVVWFDPDSRGALDFKLLARELVETEVDLGVGALDHWMTLLHGPQVSEAGVTFVADFPQAKAVQVTGSFCDWSTGGVPLRKRNDGLWECQLDLAAGVHEYRYVVDGVWIADPHNEAVVTNEFGGQNNLVTVT
jgi:chromosome partitioning protein